MSAEDGNQPRAGAGDAVAPEANAGSETAPPNVIGPERDDLSFPPVDFDAAFFARPHRASHLADEWARDPTAELKASPLAKRRRAQLKKYVSLAMGVASAVCLAALVKGALTSPEGGSSPQRHFSAAAERVPRSLPEPVAEQERALPPTAPASELVAPPPTAPAPEPVAPAPTAPAPEPVAAAPTAPAPELVAPPPTAPATEPLAHQEEPKTGNETPAPDPGEAVKQKRASRLALERGRTAASIEAGEHAVLLDPLDAEAWLILGAAYQQKGSLAEARRCYKACVERAQRGDRRECLAMLR